MAECAETSSPEAPRRRRLLRTISWLLCAVLLLALAYSLRHDRDTLAALLKVGPAWLGAMLAMWFLLTFPTGLQRKLMLRRLGLDLSFVDWYGLPMVTNVIGLVSPVRGDLVLGAAYLKRRYGLALVHFASTIYANGVLLAITLAVEGCLGLLLLGLVTGRWDAKVWAIFGTVGAAGLLFMLVPYRLVKGRNWVTAKIRSALEGWSYLRSDPLLVMTLVGLIMLNTGLFTAWTYLAFVALGFEVHLALAFFVAVTTQMSMFFALTPGNLGVREAVVGFLAMALGLGYAEGVAVTLLQRAVGTVAYFLVGGAFSFVILPRLTKPRSDADGPIAPSADTPTWRPPEDLRPVVDNGFCIGCGACVAADPTLHLHLNPSSQMYEPSGPGSARAAAVCPAVHVDFDSLQRLRFPGAAAGPLGVCDSVCLAQSTDHELNLAASSGGMVKEVLGAYLAREDVAGVIALDHVQGLRFEPRCIRSGDELRNLPGSIYHHVAYDRALRLLEEQSGRLVIVGIPCQLEGLYSYVAKCKPQLQARIHATVGLVCGWTYNHHALRAICRFKGADFSQIQDVAYRGGGPVGDLRLVIPERQVRVNRRWDFDVMVAFDRSFNLRRCHLCVNHLNYLADVVVGDAWLSRVADTKTGVSLVICRTAEATEQLTALQRQGRIRTAPAEAEADCVESQGRRLVYGDFAYAYADFLAATGRFRPQMTAPNRSGTQLVPRWEVARFHRQNQQKIALQRRGAYRRLWWRKLLLDSLANAWRLARKVMRRRTGGGGARPTAGAEAGGLGFR